LLFNIYSIVHSEHLGLEGRIILKWIFNKWEGSMDWIYVEQDRDRWLTVVNALMNLRVA
jgi:hypothetical protein